MLESKFQSNLIRKLKNEYPESVIQKLDSSYTQGIPDLLILYKDKWAVLECKKSKNAAEQANQEYYVSKLNSMSYSAFVQPENEEEVLNAIQRLFKG